MKSCLVALVLIFAVSTAFAEIDPPVARIRLTKVEVITTRQLQAQIEKFEAASQVPLTEDVKRQLLDNMVDTRLLLQAAERENVRVSQTEIDGMVGLFKQQVALQGGLNPNMTDADFERILKQEDPKLTWDEFIEQITDQIKVRNYIQTDQIALFQAVGKPGEEEIRDFYESNKTAFVSPEMVRFKQIVLRAQGLEAEDAGRAGEMANEIFRELESGASFDKYQEVYLEDSRTLIGGIVFDTWRRDDQRKQIEYGKSFFDSVFKIGEGARSQVLKSNYGYHIVEVIEKFPFTVLTLTDKIPPQRVISVRDYISEGLLQQKNEAVFETATQEAIAKLKGEAEIKIYEENLPF